MDVLSWIVALLLLLLVTGVIVFAVLQKKKKPIPDGTQGTGGVDWKSLFPSFVDLTKIDDQEKPPPLIPTGLSPLNPSLRPSDKTSTTPWSDLVPANIPWSPLSPSISPDTPQEAQFRVTNLFDFPVWVEARGTVLDPVTKTWVAGHPLPDLKNPGQFIPTPQKLEPQKSLDFFTDPGGLAGFKSWAMIGCNEDGSECEIGQQMQFAKVGGGCPKNGCQVPISTSLEATFSCRMEDQSLCNPNPADLSKKIGNTTYFNVSLVDGATYPFRVLVKGDDRVRCNCPANVPTDQCSGLSMIDGSKWDVSQCPSDEDLSFGGRYPNAQLEKERPPNLPETVDLTKVDLRYVSKDGKRILGCASPAQKMTFGFPFGFHLAIDDADPKRPLSVPASITTCPTPVRFICDKKNQTGCEPGVACIDTCTSLDCKNSNVGICENCKAENGCLVSDTCNAPGGIIDTKYVKLAKKLVPSAYAWAYDDVRSQF